MRHCALPPLGIVALGAHVPQCSSELGDQVQRGAVIARADREEMLARQAGEPEPHEEVLAALPELQLYALPSRALVSDGVLVLSVLVHSRHTLSMFPRPM